jgi:hypothetical protein
MPGGGRAMVSYVLCFETCAPPSPHLPVIVSNCLALAPFDPVRRATTGAHTVTGDGTHPFATRTSRSGFCGFDCERTYSAICSHAMG